MKYFARYLPIEGEIKEHDYVLWTKASRKGTVVHLHDRACVVEFSDNSTPTINNEDLRVLKLHLCSTNIQVGDNVQDIAGIKYEMTQQRFSLFEKEKGHLKSLIFKVIGDISPDATWVKEADEFEEDQIKYWKCFPQNTYRIKGPCGRFH